MTSMAFKNLLYLLQLLWNFHGFADPEGEEAVVFHLWIDGRIIRFPDRHTISK